MTDDKTSTLASMKTVEFLLQIVLPTIGAIGSIGALLVQCGDSKKKVAPPPPPPKSSASSGGTDALGTVEPAKLNVTATVEVKANGAAAPVAKATVVVVKPADAAATDNKADEKNAVKDEPKDKKDDAVKSVAPGANAADKEAIAKDDEKKIEKTAKSKEKIKSSEKAKSKEDKKERSGDKDKAGASKKENKSEIKPKKIGLDAKAKHIAESKEKRGKSDYPTMDDVLSDWDSEKDGAKEGGKAKPKVSKEKTKTKDATNLDDEKEEGGGKDAK